MKNYLISENIFEELVGLNSVFKIQKSIRDLKLIETSWNIFSSYRSFGHQFFERDVTYQSKAHFLSCFTFCWLQVTHDDIIYALQSAVCNLQSTCIILVMYFTVVLISQTEIMQSKICKCQKRSYPAPVYQHLIFEKWILKNGFWQTPFLFYFKLKFCMLHRQ